MLSGTSERRAKQLCRDRQPGDFASLRGLTSACASSNARQVSALTLGSPGACISMRSILMSKYCNEV